MSPTGSLRGPFLTVLSDSISLNPERPAYIPPHLRNRAQGAAPPVQPFHTPAAAVAPPPVPLTNGTNGYHPQTGLPTPAPTPVPAQGTYVPPTARLGASTTVPDDGGWGAPRKPAPDARSLASLAGGAASAQPGYGVWKNGHVVGQRNMRMEKELFGEVGDGVHAVSGGPDPWIIG